MELVPAAVTVQQQQQQRHQHHQDQQWRHQLQALMQLVRSHLEESVGHLPMEWPLEAVHQAHSVAPGCPMEAPGMAALPGIVWLCLNWPLGLPVTTATLSRWVSVTLE